MSLDTNSSKDALKELKTNRRLQMVLAVGAVAMVALLWPESKKPRSTGRILGATVNLDDPSLAPLKKLPDLATLGQQGELPNEDRMYRDLNTFDLPPPPPPPPTPPPPPPPPPTPEELAAQALQREKDAQMALRPQGLRYLGYLEQDPTGRFGAFMKGEEPNPITLNSMVGPQWKLVRLTDTLAEFQNLKFPELRHTIRAVDASGSSSSITNRRVTNQF